MLERIESGPEITNGTKGTRSNIKGKVIKVMIESSTNLNNVNIDFYTDVGEFMFTANGLLKGTQVFYPTNTITNNLTDYFYLMGPVVYMISGLDEGETITNIVILSENS